MAEQPHHAQRLEPHLPQVLGPLVPFDEPRKKLNLVANLRVAGQVGRLHPPLADPLARLAFGPVVFRFLTVVHQPGGFPGNLPPDFVVGHVALCAPR